MSTTSKFVNLNPNVLLEWIYDDTNFLAEDYYILINTLQNTRGFINAETTNTLPSTTNNYASTNLFPVDAPNNKWGLIDQNAYPFLQLVFYPGNIPYRYDKIRVHFPINYNFDNYVGFVLNVNVLDRTGKIYENLSNFYYDKTDLNRSLEYTAPPFLFNEKLYGKFLEIQVPAPVALANDVSVSSVNNAPVPTLGNINSNLAGPSGLGVGPNSPIFIDFSFILQKNVVNKQTTFLLQDPYGATIPQVPEFQTLAVNIQPSKEGDWFEIGGFYDGTMSGFQTFIEQQALNGNDQYAIFTVTVFEKNVQTDQIQYIVQDNFDVATRFRPIISFSTTTAVIDVEMKLINTVTNNFITRLTTYVMMQDEVAKYSRILTKINVSNAFKPKIYQASPDIINVTTVGNNAQIQKINVPFPVMFDRHSVLAKNVSATINDETFYGTGQLQILLYPTDNVIKFAIAENVDNSGAKPFAIPTGLPVTLTFKSDTQTVDCALYPESNQIDYPNGIVVFRILESQISAIQAIAKQGFDQFYIIMKPTSGVNTVLYSGRYLLYNNF